MHVLSYFLAGGTPYSLPCCTKGTCLWALGAVKPYLYSSLYILLPDVLQDLKTEVMEKEEDLRDITGEKPRIYTAEGGAPSPLGQRVEKVEARWAELQGKVDARSQQFSEGLSSWNVFQGELPFPRRTFPRCVYIPRYVAFQGV